jgi:hypothetical protein
MITSNVQMVARQKEKKWESPLIEAENLQEKCSISSDCKSSTNC